jgi:hypothetical protein
MKKWLSQFRPIELLMVGWTILALIAIPLWEGSTWLMPTMVSLLLAAVALGWYLEPRR